VKTIEQAVRPKGAFLDPTFSRRWVAVNAAVPLVLLGWDAYRGQLGVNGVSFAIHTTGLVGLLLLLLSLAVTPLRTLTGWNTLIAVRRTLGLASCLYLCVHLAIFYWFDRSASLRDAAHEILTRRYLQIGAISLGLMSLLALTSIGAVVNWLGARRWKRLHRLVYVAAILGSIHYCLLVKADLRQPLVFTAVLAMLLGFRAVHFAVQRRRKRLERKVAPSVPRQPRFWSGELRVLRIVEEAPDVRTFRLGPKAGGSLPFVHRAGQYLNLALTIDGARINRSYTIASSPVQTSFCELTVKRKPDGYASKYLHDVLRQGQALRVSAPFGRFVFTGTEASKVLLIAGGVGITPVMSILRHLADKSWPGQAHLVYSARRQEDIVFAKEIASLQQRLANLHVCVTLSGATDSSWTGERGHVTADLLRRHVPAPGGLPIYLCGPDAMMASTRAILLGLGFSEDKINTEAFAASGRTDAMSRRPVDGAPASTVVTREPTASGAGSLPTVRFERSKKGTELPATLTVLEAAEAIGVKMPFECRSGICGQCKTKLLEGQVTMDVEDALAPGDKAHGIILACQARSTKDVAVDA
jgi:glycine betaine catabolism B